MLIFSLCDAGFAQHFFLTWQALFCGKSSDLPTRCSLWFTTERVFSMDISSGASVLSSRPGKPYFLLLHQGQLSTSPNSCVTYRSAIHTRSDEPCLCSSIPTWLMNAFLGVFCDLMERNSVCNAESNGSFCWFGFFVYSWASVGGKFFYKNIYLVSKIMWFCSSMTVI